MAVQLYGGAAFALGSAFMFAIVGRVVAQRRVSEEARTASALFAVWWYGLAGVTALGAVNSIAAAVGVRNLAFYVSGTMVALLVLCVILFALLYYLLFLFIGRRGLLGPLAMGYVLYFAFLVWYVIQREPQGILVHRWNIEIDYANDVTNPVTQLLVALLILPVIAGALAYFTLYFRTREKEQRYRIAMVSWSIIVWFGSAYAASVSPLAQADWWQVVSRVIGLLAASATLMAYKPPAWIQRRLAPASSEQPPPAPRSQLRAAWVATRVRGTAPAFERTFASA